MRDVDQRRNGLLTRAAHLAHLPCVSHTIADSGRLFVWKALRCSAPEERREEGKLGKRLEEAEPKSRDPAEMWQHTQKEVEDMGLRLTLRDVRQSATGASWV